MNINVDYNFLVYIVNNSSMKKTQQEWQQESKKANIIIFFYKEMVLNLTSFLKFHPGGTKALMPYVNKDITDILFNVFPHHKQQTNRVLDQYRIGYNTSSSDYNEQKKSLVKQPKIEFKSKKKVEFQVKKQNFNEPSQRGRKNKTNALAQVKLNKSKSKSKSTKNLTSIKEILEKYHEQQRKKKSYAELLKQRVKQQKEKVKVVFITFQDDLDLQNQSQQNKQTINIPILKPIFIHKP